MTSNFDIYTDGLISPPLLSVRPKLEEKKEEK